MKNFKTFLLLVTLASCLLNASCTTISSQVTPNEEDFVSTEENISNPTSSTIPMTDESDSGYVVENIKGSSAERKSTQPPSRPSIIPEGSFNSPCNATTDCQPNRNLECFHGVCLCEEPQLFDLPQQKCVLPLGKECNPDLLGDESKCPEFAECFMERCVCKTGYSMYTMTRCKADYTGFEEHVERKPKTVLWPHSSNRHQSTEQGDDGGELGCTPNSCDETKGLACQPNGACKCKNRRDLFIEEFGRCLNSSTLKPLKDALASLDSAEDDLKSFGKLLEKVDILDHETGASEHYNSPIHQLVGLLGGGETSHSEEEEEEAVHSREQQASPKSDDGYGDMHTAAQESAPTSAYPNHNGASNHHDDEGNDGRAGHSAAGHGETYPTSHSYTPTEGEAHREPLTYGMDSGEAYGNGNHAPSNNNHYHMPIQNYENQPQNSDAVSHRHVPYGQQHAEDIPLANYGVIPEGTRHFPFGLGVRHGHGHGHHGLFGDHGLDHGHHHGHHHRPHHGHHHHAPIEKKPELKKKPSLIGEIGELLGKSFKLIDKFLPLIHAINGILKKEAIIGKTKDKLLHKDDDGDDHREKRMDDDKKEDIIKEGAILAGFTKFIGLLLRLKKRLDLVGGDALKKLLT